MENAKEWVAFFEKIGYPHGVRAYRTRIGDERATCRRKRRRGGQ